MIVRLLMSWLASGAVDAPTPPPIPLAAEVTLRHRIYHAEGVTGYLLRIPPGQGTQMHRHDKDLLTVFISGGRTTAVFEGSPPRTDSLAAGTVRYRTAGFAHSTRNEDTGDFRAVLFEFDHLQGPRSEPMAPSQIFCTERFCVQDDTLRPGEKLNRRGRGLFVPIEDMLVRDASGRRHRERAGGVWAGRGGWINVDAAPARIISILFR